MKKIIFLLAFCSIGCSQEPQTIAELQTAGKKAFVAENYALSQTYLHKILKLKSSDREALYYLGQTFQKLHQDDSAIYYLKRADLLHPNDRELNLAIYKSAKIIDDYQNAINAIKVIIKTGDSREQHLFELANLNLKAGNIFVSFLRLRELWENGTDDPNLYLVYANVSAQVDSVDLAVKITEESINRFGDSEQSQTNLAIYLAAASRLEESEKVLHRLLKKDPKSQKTKLNLANILSMYDTKTKKEESLALYSNLRIEYGNIYNIDSIIIKIQTQLDTM